MKNQGYWPEPKEIIKVVEVPVEKIVYVTKENASTIITHHKTGKHLEIDNLKKITADDIYTGKHLSTGRHLQ